MSFTLVDVLLAGFAVVYILAGLGIVGMAIRAYKQTTHRAMLYLSVGFVVLVVGHVGVSIGVVVRETQTGEQLFLLGTGFDAIGIILVMYSLIIYE